KGALLSFDLVRRRWTRALGDVHLGGIGRERSEMFNYGVSGFDKGGSRNLTARQSACEYAGHSVIRPVAVGFRRYAAASALVLASSLVLAILPSTAGAASSAPIAPGVA